MRNFDSQFADDIDASGEFADGGSVKPQITFDDLLPGAVEAAEARKLSFDDLIPPTTANPPASGPWERFQGNQSSGARQPQANGGSGPWEQYRVAELKSKPDGKSREATPLAEPNPFAQWAPKPKKEDDDSWWKNAPLYKGPEAATPKPSEGNPFAQWAPKPSTATPDKWWEQAPLADAPKPGAMVRSFDAMGSLTGHEEPAVSAPTGPTFADSIMRGAIQGATLGGGDEAYAAASATASSLGRSFSGDSGKSVSDLVTGKPAPTWKSDFDRELAGIQERNRAAREAHPWLYGGAQIAGAIPGLVYAGGTRLGAQALGLAGKYFLGRTAASAGSGAALGAAQGYLGEDGDVDARKNAGHAGLLWGGGLGAVMPAAGAGLGAAARFVLPWLRPQAEATGLAAGTAKALSDDLTASGGATAVRQRLNELGPEGMLLDASPSFLGQAQGLGVRPDTRQLIQDALERRNAGANARLQSEVDSALGPAPIPSRIRSDIERSQAALSPEYEAALRDGRAVNTLPIANWLEEQAIMRRGSAQSAMRKVRDMLDIPGSADRGGRAQLDPSPRTLFETRKAIDGMIGAEKDAKAIGALSEARQLVDAELAARVPGVKAIDARFAELARQEEALQRGSMLLDAGKTAVRPQELLDEVLAGVTPQGSLVGPSAATARLRQGLRADIDRHLGTNANDLVALQRALRGEGDWNRAKIGMAYGQDRADQLINAVDRETAFRDAFNTVVKGSQSTQRAEAAKRMEPRGMASAERSGLAGLAGIVGGIPGVAAYLGPRAAQGAYNSVVRGIDLARNKELARILTEQNRAKIDELLLALETSRNARRAINDNLPGRINRGTQMLLRAQEEPSRPSTEFRR